MRRMIRKSDKSNSWLTAFLSRENRPFHAIVVRLSSPALPAPAKLLAPPASNEAVRKSMKGNKRSNTKPELLVRERLRAAGLTGYRLQWKVPGHPDVAWPGKRVALFVNGCFWPRCPHCQPSMPTSNVEYWVVQFERTVERADRRRDVSNPDGVLSPEAVARMDAVCAALRGRGLAQVAVVAVDDIAGGDTFSFAVELFGRWGVGGAESDNGLGILLVKDLREIRFVTGGGVEGVLPAAPCPRIPLRHILPPFWEAN